MKNQSDNKQSTFLQEKKLVMSSNMSISDNRRYSPELCFPGFDGEWVVKKLGEIADSIVVGFPFKGNDLTDDNSGTLILRGMSIGDGVIKHGGEYDKYYLGDISALQKYILHKDDIVMGMDGSIGRNIALVGEKEHNSLLIQRVARIRVKNIPLHIVYQQITSQRFKVYVASEKVGAVIAHISQKQIEEFPIFVPTLPEQQMIAECLSSLDDVIAAESDRLIALKNHKKGLMQQLFPQKGQTLPSKRFPGFIGEWEVKKFKEFTCSVGMKNKKNESYESYSISNEYGFIPQQEQFEGTGGYLKDADRSMYIIVPPKSFAYNPARINVGSIGYQNLGKSVIVSSLYEVFQTLDCCDDGFLWHWMHSSHFNNMVLDVQEGGVRQYLFYENLKECKIALPKEISEQKKIAECLTSLDDEILAQQQKVDALKEHKRGLMQKLFPIIK